MIDSDVQNGVQVSSKYQVMPGAAYGIQQATFSGEIKLKQISQCDFSSLKSFMEKVLEEPVPDCPYQDESYGCAFYLMYWSLSIQRQQRISVLGNGYLRKIREDADGWVTFFMALPHVHVKCSAQSLLWVSKLINLFFDKSELTQQDYAGAEQSLSTLQRGFRRYSVQGDNAFWFLSAAHGLNLPATQALPGVYRFGTGRYLRYMESTLTDRTPVLGVSICRDKGKTATLLRQAGLPAPRHQRVNSPEQAIEAAEALGYPVVVKPVDRERGEGVYANLSDSNAVAVAFQAASKISQNILLEKHQDGEDYRFTVFNGRVINIFSRRAGGVTGNGINTVVELVEIEQQSPRFRRNFRLNGKFPLVLDEEALSLLAEKNLTKQSVLKKGEYVALRRKSNISAGGSFENLKSSEVHSDNIMLATRIAKMLGLDFAGIDFITLDIKKSWLETELIVCEVNAMPQIGSAMTIKEYQEVLSDFMQERFNIDAHLFVCLSSSLQPAYEQLSVISEQLGCNAFSTVEGIWINGKKWSKPFKNGFDSACALLACPEVEAGLSVMSMAEVILYGLPVGSYKSIRFILPEKGLVELAHDRDFNKTCELIRSHSLEFFIYKGAIDAKPSRLKFS